MHDLLLELLNENPSTGREAVLVEVAADLYPDWLSTDELKELLRGNDSHGANRVVGRLYSLQKKLEELPPADLFDEPVKNWRPIVEGRYGQYEVKLLLDHTLAALIKATPDLQADRLYMWLLNFRRRPYSQVEKEGLKAVQEWLKATDTRSVALFEVILESLKSGDVPRTAIREYTIVTGTHPPVAIINHFLDMALATKVKKAKRAALEIAADLAAYSPCDAEAYWRLYAAVIGVKGYRNITRKITYSKLPQWTLMEGRRTLGDRSSVVKEREHVISILAPISNDIRQGNYPQKLDWFAQQYFGYGARGETIIGISAVADQLNSELIDAFLSGCEFLAKKGIDIATPALLGEMEVENSRYYAELAAIAGVDILIEKGRLPPIGEMPLLVAMFIVKSGYIAARNDKTIRVLEWAVERFNYSPEEGAQALAQYWGAMLERGYGRLTGTELVIDGRLKGIFYQNVIADIFQRFPAMPSEALRRLIPGAVGIFGNERILEFAERAIENFSIDDSARQLWILVAFLIAPTRYHNEFVSVYSSLASDLRSYDEERIIKSIKIVSEDDRAAVDYGIASALGITVPPRDEDGFVGAGINMRASIDRLANSASNHALLYLKNLLENPQLETWQTYVRHALAVRQRIARDANFVHPTPEAANEALKNGPPLNAADLRAVIVEEMGRLQRELRTADNAPWKRFWSSDKDGKPTQPLIENECRNYVLDRLRDRLVKYRVVAVLPEAQRADSTRADMLVLSHAGKNLPIEIKRHYHPAVWEAASTQLQGYSADVGAEGLGVYLVIWFGTTVAKVPKRTNGATLPGSAIEMEDMLRADLSDDLRNVVDVFVFDVSQAK